MRPTLIFTGILGLGLFGMISSHSSLNASLLERRQDAMYEPDRQLVQADVRKALFLNYDTFSSDLLWISLQLYMSDFREAGAKAPPPAHMIEYGELIHAIDPNFTPVYEWLNAAYINSRLPIDSTELHRITDFFLKGAPYVEDPGDLYYHAGMNFIGYSHEHTREEKIAGIKRGIELLQQASMYPASNAKIPGVVSYLFSRLERLQTKEESDQVESTQALIEYQRATYTMAGDQQTREYIVAKLRELGVTDQELEELRRRHGPQVDLLKQAYRAYLPDTLWLTLYGESPEFFTPTRQDPAP